MNKFALCLTLLSIVGAISAGTIVGGKTPITDRKQLDSLVGKVSTYLEKINDQYNVELEFVRSYRATSQVVSGVAYEMFAEINENGQSTDCKINLWQQSWLNHVRMTVNCGEGKSQYSYESASSSEISAPIPGGFRAMTRPELKKLEPEVSAVFDQLKAEKENFDYTFQRIVSGKQQVVAGMHYIVKVEATNSADETTQCEADIFRNLKGKFEDVQIKCGGKSYRYPFEAGLFVVGGKERITDGKEMSDLTKKVNFYLGKINENGAQLELVRPRSATRQVVEGTAYEMFAEMNENGHPTDCKINLWEKPWMNFVHVDVECGDGESQYSYESSSSITEARQITLGGFRKMRTDEINRFEPKVSAVFDQLRAEKEDFDYTFQRIVDGKQQVIAGDNYVVRVEATNNAGKMTRCEADISQNLKGKFEYVKINCEGKTFYYNEY